MDFIPIANTFIGEEEAKAVYSIVKSGWISMGEKVKEFEKMAAEYLGVEHAVAFNNGTSSLHAVLIALDVKEGDEVLVPTLSYVSSANVILYCRATPIFCESDPDTFNVTADEVAKRITPKTKAIMTVDLKGMPVDYDAILQVAQEHNIPVLSDSAESFGAIYKDNLVGRQCPVHSFSFFANKNITMGEGGLIATNDDKIADVCQTVRNQGQSERYKHVIIGNNYRLTDISAAFGIEQMKRIEWIMEEKNKVAAYYNNAFDGHSLISIPYVPSYVNRHSWYMYCLKLDRSVDRDLVIQKMRENGVDSRLSFPPIHLQPIYMDMFGYQKGDYPMSEDIFNTFIDIPCWVGMNEDLMNRVIEIIIKAVEEARK